MLGNLARNKFLGGAEQQKRGQQSLQGISGHCYRPG
jgi:hypothetical protein